MKDWTEEEKKKFAVASLIALAIFLFWFGLGYIAGAAGESVRDNAYGITGRWASLQDYQAGVLTVDGITASPCSQGVIYLGDSRYRVPEGVRVFECVESSKTTGKESILPHGGASGAFTS